ncbi:MAG TPA: response regulator [Burkholderiaceae bacterium]
MTQRIFLVDDDAAVRSALGRLLGTLDLPVMTCADGAALFAALEPRQSGCIVLDLDLPGDSGLDVQQALRQRRIDMPLIFLTGKGSVASTAQALKAGAFDFLEKPVDSGLLLSCVRDALAHDAAQRERAALRERAEARLERLTAREREVVVLTLNGLANKQIAQRLGISHRTVEIHRARAMQKMGAANLLELDRMINPVVPQRRMG